VTDFNLPDKDDAPWLDCMDGFQNLEDTNKRTDTIAPPFELIKQWAEESPMECSAESWAYELFIVHHAAQWGADQELEACCEWLVNALSEDPQEVSQELRAARRPKPPSLKEQALTALYAIATGANDAREQHQDFDTIRQALEQLDDE